MTALIGARMYFILILIYISLIMKDAELPFPSSLHFKKKMSKVEMTFPEMSVLYY